MNQLSTTITRDFAHAFRTFGTKVQELAAPLTEAQFWSNPFPYGNSFGHLVLHLTGNLNYYLGAEIGASGYVRDREREFTDANPPAKAEALWRLEETVALVISVLEQQTAEDWGKAYEAVGAQGTSDRFAIFLRCAAHFHHHIGQMIYLVKEHERKELL